MYLSMLLPASNLLSRNDISGIHADDAIEALLNL